MVESVMSIGRVTSPATHTGDRRPSAELIRNVVLVGPSGAGKTTLAEALLLATGVIARAGKVEDGSTVTDWDEAELRQHRSVSLALAPLTFGGITINILDTPGYADFVGEVRAGLRGADAALFVIGATDGIDAATTMLWEECAAVEMPRAVVVTKLDKERADFDETVAVCQRLFGDGVLPLYLPMAADDGHAAGLIGLLSQQVYDYSAGVRVQHDPDPEHLPLIENARSALLEAIIQESEDDTLMDRYLAGDDIDLDVVTADLEKAVARGTFFPVLGVGLTPSGYGVAELLEVIARGFPSPAEHPLPPVSTPTGEPKAPLTCDPDGPLLAEVIKTTTDPYVGRVSLVRVFSGTLRPDDVVHVSGHYSGASGHTDHDVDERVGSLATPLGKHLRPTLEARAGDIVSVAKLSRAETGDTLSGRDFPLLMTPWITPDPLLPVAVVAHSKADEDKLASGLGRLVAEDPTLRLERNADTGQVVLWAMGEAHVDVLLDRLRNRYGVAVDATELRVSLRETFGEPAVGHGRLVKQSGGHGQYAVCSIEVEPLPTGSGFEFVDRIVGAAIPRHFIASVEKGIRGQLEKGVHAGYPVVDIRVTLVDGKAHSVDSSDMAFAQAGALALKDAASKAAIRILEPVDDIEVFVADEYVGAVMSDLSVRRGKVSGSEPTASGRTVVRASVPQLELTRYAVEIRSLSHGTATFTRTFAGHEPAPASVVRRVVGTA